MKLYIYDHCPYCVRARMIFGLKNLPVQLCILPGDDAATPEAMIGKKMLPVLQKNDGSYLAESMDIVHYVDQLDGRALLTGTVLAEITQWINDTDSYLSRLLLPRMVRAPFAEFISQSARDDFSRKKQVLTGDFAENIANSGALIQQFNNDLERLAPLLRVNRDLSVNDIQLFPLLRNAGMIAGVNYPSPVADYRDSMAQRSCVNLLYPVL